MIMAGIEYRYIGSYIFLLIVLLMLRESTFTKLEQAHVAKYFM